MIPSIPLTNRGVTSHKELIGITWFKLRGLIMLFVKNESLFSQPCHFGSFYVHLRLTSSKAEFFSLPLLPKAKRSVGNKESGLDMLRPKIKYSLKLSYGDDKICTFVISTVNTC